MSEASIGMLVVSILGGLVSIGIALYAASVKDRGYAAASVFSLLVTMIICGICWRFLPQLHDHQKRGYVEQQYRERVWKHYETCFNKCRTAVQDTLNRTEEKETKR